MPRVVAGIDPGLTNTGVVVMDMDFKVLSANLVQAKASPAKRLYDIELALNHILSPFEKPTVFIEGYAYQAKYQRESLAELGGVLRRYFYLEGLEYWVIPPLTLKEFVTGSARANKNYMIKRTKERWNENFKSDHVCDAYGLARLGAYCIGKKHEPMYQSERKVVTEVFTNRASYFEKNTAARLGKKRNSKKTDILSEND